MNESHTPSQPNTDRHITCPRCGYRNSPGRVTCEQCGINLAQAVRFPPLDQPEGNIQQDKEAREGPAYTRSQKWVLFSSGFFGWFLVTVLIYGQKFSPEALMMCGGLLFLVNAVVLVLLLSKLRPVGWGMLSALGVNFVISLMLGLANNAVCFIPFYKQ